MTWQAIRRFRRGLLYRTALLIISAFVLSGLLSLGYGVWKARERAHQQAEARIAQLIDTVESTANVAGFAQDRVLAQDIARGLLRNSGVQRVEILGTGVTLARLDKAGGLDRSGEARAIRRALHSPFPPGQSIGEIRLYPDEAAVEAGIRQEIQLASESFLFQLALVALAVIGTILLLLVRPLKLVSDQMHAMRPESGQRLRTPPQHEDSEFGRLVRDINALADELVSSLEEERTLLRLQSVEQKKYKAIFDHAESGLFLLDDAGRLSSWNRAFAGLVGLEPGPDGSAPPCLMDLAWKDSGRLQALARQALDAGAPASADLSITTAGEVRWLRLVLSPVDAGLLQGVTLDITAEKELVQRLETARVVAEEVSQAKSMFLANMSHEIRTPLHAISGQVQLLRRAGPTPEQAERLRKIELAGAHLLEVINAILDLSKIESGRFTLEETDLDVMAVLGKVHTLLAESAAAKGLELRLHADNLPRALVGDPTRLGQALINYVNNAIKFTHAGQVLLSARLEAETADSALVRFEVRDTGVGIPKDKLEQVFTAFEQADNSTTRQYGGTGLGLAITQNFARLMGGEAGVESTPGVGSTFWFTARLKKGQTASLALAPVSEAALLAALKRRHAERRILVVEDEMNIREVTLILLGDAFRHIDVAEDGAEAVERVRDNDYDLILMDMQMPRLDGIAAARVIRTLPNGQDPVIVAMTANAFAEDKANCLAAGMDDFLTKPSTVVDLYQTVLRGLDEGRAPA